MARPCHEQVGRHQIPGNRHSGENESSQPCHIRGMNFAGDHNEQLACVEKGSRASLLVSARETERVFSIVYVDLMFFLSLESLFRLHISSAMRLE
jgi:hypothetical protein